MLYVLRYKGAFEGNFVESFYDEIVTVKNRIALVRGEHVKNCLLGMNFEDVGIIDKEENLPELFKSQETVEVKVRKETVSNKKTNTVEQSTTVPLDSILPKPEKDWYDKIA